MIDKIYYNTITYSKYEDPTFGLYLTCIIDVKNKNNIEKKYELIYNDECLDIIDYVPQIKLSEALGYYEYNYEQTELLYLLVSFDYGNHDNYSYWYNDKKCKCMRLWKYSLQNFKKLIKIQKFIWWNYLLKKLQKKEQEIYIEVVVKLLRKLPLDTINNTCKYLLKY